MTGQQTYKKAEKISKLFRKYRRLSEKIQDEDSLAGRCSDIGDLYDMGLLIKLESKRDKVWKKLEKKLQ